MKIVFMGTPDFSVEPLKALVKAGHEVSLVLTREDKKRNRGELSPTPVKELALSFNIPVLTPSGFIIFPQLAQGKESLHASYL